MVAAEGVAADTVPLPTTGKKWIPAFAGMTSSEVS
jgi:hypothetical protein